MGKLREHLKNQGRSGVGSGAKRTPFYKFSNGANTVRFITFAGEDGEEDYYFQWLNHQLGRTKSEACRKTFDEEEHCDLCEQVRLLYEAKEDEEAGQKRGKKTYWFVVVPLDGGEPEYHWLQLPWKTTNRLFQNLALRNGWTEDEPDFNSDEFLDALEKGIETVWGHYDVTFTYHKNAAPIKKYGKISISSGPGAEIEIEEEVPDPVAAWKLIKRWGRNEEQEESAPALEEMSREDVEEYAKSLGVKFNKRLKTETLIKRIRDKEAEDE